MFKLNYTKTFSHIAILTIAALSFVFLAPPANAITPTLSLSLQSDGNTVQLTAAGDPNKSVILFYNKTGVGTTIQPLGSTNSNGNFSLGVSTSSYGVTPGSPAYITVGGINEPQSQSATWPFPTSTSNSLTLSQTGMALNVGQTLTLTATNTSSNALYLSSNSNGSIANVNFNGNQINVVGISKGTTIATICVIGNTTNCPTINIVVQNSGAPTLIFSQNNFTVNSGQSVTVTVTGGSGAYTILNNSNTSAIQASINGGNIITFSAVNTTGSASVTICSSDMNSCGVINVLAGASSSASVFFSQNNPTLSIGQNMTISISGGGGSGSYYVSTNSNPSIVQVSVLNNTTMSITGLLNGSSILNICSSGGGCGAMTVTVNSNAGNGSITLSQNTLSLVVGQSSNITIFGNGNYYVSTNSTPAVASTSVNGSSLIVSALNTGTSNISVCQIGGGCSSVMVSVSTAIPTIPVGCSSSTKFSTVNGQSCPNYVAPTNPTQPQASSVYIFSKHLTLGDNDDDVFKLQQLLVGWGYLKATPNGHFGPATETALKAFQKANGLSALGYAGPGTRSALNSKQSSSSSSSTKAQQIQALQLQIQQLQAQLTALQTQ